MADASLKDRIARGAAGLGALQLLNRVLDLLSVLVLARLLTPEDFGLVALASSVMLIAQTVTDLPVVDALVQRDKITSHDIDSAFTVNLLRGGLVVGAMALVAGPMAALYDDPRLAPMIGALALVPLCKALESPALAHALRAVNYAPLARSLFVGKLAGTALSVAVALLTGSLWSLVVGLVATGAISAGWTYRLCPYRPRLRFRGLRALIDFAGWITLSRIVFVLNQQGDQFFVGYFIGKGPLGQYSVGSMLSGLTTHALAGPVARPLFAGMARLQDDPPRLRAAYLKSQQAMMLLIVPFGFCLAALADRLVPLLLGPGWEMAVLAVWWLAPVIALQMLSGAVQSLAMAQGATRVLAWRETLALVLRLPATLWGAWQFGLLGALVARALTGLIIIVMNLYVARRLIGAGVGRQLVNGWRSLASALIMTALLLGLQAVLPAPQALLLEALSLAGLIAIGLTTYGATHLALWHLAGRPDGAETYVLELAARLRRKA